MEVLTMTDGSGAPAAADPARLAESITPPASIQQLLDGGADPLEYFNNFGQWTDTEDREQHWLIHTSMLLLPLDDPAALASRAAADRRIVEAITAPGWLAAARARVEADDPRSGPDLRFLRLFTSDHYGLMRVLIDNAWSAELAESANLRATILAMATPEQRDNFHREYREVHGHGYVDVLGHEPSHSPDLFTSATLATVPALELADDDLVEGRDVAPMLPTIVPPDHNDEVGELVRLATPDELIDAHLENLRFRNCSPGTIDQRRYLLRRFARFLEGRPMLEVTPDEIVAFLRRPMRGPGERVPKSIISDLGGLTTFYRWALFQGLRDDNPCDRVDKPKVPRNLPRPIDEARLIRALATAPDRVRPMLILAAYAGLRAIEVAQLRGEDLRRDTTPPILTIRRQKGGDATSIPVSPIIVALFDSMPRHGWLFPRMDGEPGPIKAYMVSHLANDHLHRIGYLDTFHSLRHRFGTQVYRASGRDIRQTQELLRHRSITSTAIYTKVDPVEAAATVASLPGAG
jgi:integrase